MAKQSSRAFTDTDFVMLTPEEPDTFDEDVDAVETGGFKIEEVEIPKRSSVKKTLAYPIGTLKAGSNQSFFVPTTPETAKAVTSSIRTFAYRNGFKAVIRQEKLGVRVWRKQ